MLAERLGLSAAAPGQAFWVAPEPTLWNRIQFHLPWSIPLASLVLLAMLWDPAGLDQSPPATIRPRFVLPVSAQRVPGDSKTSDNVELSDAIAANAMAAAIADQSRQRPTSLPPVPEVNPPDAVETGRNWPAHRRTRLDLGCRTRRSGFGRRRS